MKRKDTKQNIIIADSAAENDDFSCTFCGKNFSVFSKVKEHIKNNHKQVKGCTETNKKLKYLTPDETAFLSRYLNLLQELSK